MLDDNVIQPQNMQYKEETGGKILGPGASLIASSSQSSPIVVPRKTRVSLTIRHVPKTKKIKIRL